MLETHMVDISQKQVTARKARAQGFISMERSTVEAVLAGKTPKGDVLTIAKIAGIQAAKQTSAWIPLCHPLSLTGTEVLISPQTEPSGFTIEATVKVNGKTGVEMEALTAVTATALTLYDMCKGLDKDMVIRDVCLLEKEGGRSGHYTRPAV